MTPSAEPILVVRVSERMGKTSGAELQAFKGVNGSGVRFQDKATGKAAMEIALGVQDPSELVYLQIRAEGAGKIAASDDVYLVQATLVVSTSKGEKELATVATTTLKSGFGVQVRSVKSNAALLNNKSPCAVRIVLERSGSKFNPSIYEVLIGVRCDPPPVVFDASKSVVLIWCPPGPRE